jgi:hypothetical protein
VASGWWLDGRAHSRSVYYRFDYRSIESLRLVSARVLWSSRVSAVHRPPRSSSTTHVDGAIRSDGCAGQFKQKGEAWFLNTLKRRGLHVAHHFFQSCHGKGPSDSEGAVVKCGLRAAEINGHHITDTAAAYLWLIGNLRIPHGSVSATGKRRHTIGARDFVFIPVSCEAN